MKNLSLAPPYHPQVRSNRDLANFYCNSEAARSSYSKLEAWRWVQYALMRLDDSCLIEMPVSTVFMLGETCSWALYLDLKTGLNDSQLFVGC